MRDWQPFLGLPLWFWLFVIPTLFALICLFYPSKAKRLMHRIEQACTLATAPCAAPRLPI